MAKPAACLVCEEAAPEWLCTVDGRDYWRCATCVATFLDPAQRLSRDDEESHYGLHQNRVDDPAYRAFLFRLAGPLMARLTATKEGLDYGCGPGPALAAMLHEAGHRMTHFDPIFHADPRALERTYDFITCTEVAEHFHAPAAEFIRLGQLLRPGGLLAVMTTFQTDDTAFPAWHYRRDPTHVVFYRPETFHVVARRHGWRCEIPDRNVVLLTKPNAAQSTATESQTRVVGSRDRGPPDERGSFAP